ADRARGGGGDGGVPARPRRPLVHGRAGRDGPRLDGAMSDLVTGYLLLGLRLGRHVDGFVDAYYGPEELARQAEAESPIDPARLAADARGLAARLDELEDPQRRRWLAAQLDGLETTARRLAGEDVPYAEEV